MLLAHDRSVIEVRRAFTLALTTCEIWLFEIRQNTHGMFCQCFIIHEHTAFWSFLTLRHYELIVVGVGQLDKQKPKKKIFVFVKKKFFLLVHLVATSKRRCTYKMTLFENINDQLYVT